MKMTIVGKLEQLIKDNLRDKNLINTDIMKLVADKDSLILAYHQIKSNPGNMTAGSDFKTLDKIDDKYMEDLVSNLKTGKFKFIPAKIIKIPKANGKVRKLCVATPRDKIVQQAILNVLMGIFEPGFCDFSYGFRPARSCHTALNHIFSNFGSCDWYVELDIAQCFDTLNHDIILYLLSRRIGDKAFMDLNRKALKAGYLYFNRFNESSVGAPQGSIISPILSNIYLHLIDMWLNQESNNFNNEEFKIIYNSRIKDNKPINKISNKILKKNSRSYDNKTFNNNILPEEKLREIESNNLNKFKYKFVRYADDIIIAVWGNKEDCINIKSAVNSYLNSIGLEMSLEKTTITKAIYNSSENSNTKGIHISSEKSNEDKEKKGKKAFFLGTEICNHNNKIIMTAPLERIFGKLAAKDFCEVIKNDFKPVIITKLVNKTELEIIYAITSTIRGLLNYYLYVSNFTILRAKLMKILKTSCAKTLGKKLKIKSVKQVYAKFGNNLNIVDNKGVIKERFNEDIIFPLAKHKKNADFKIYSNKVYNPLSIIDVFNSNSLMNTKSMFKAPCTICGSLNDIEIHHIRKLKNKSTYKISRKFPTESKILSQIHRKQIPLCSKCHKIVNDNKL